LLQLSGDFVPQTPYRALLLDPTGGLPFPRLHGPAQHVNPIHVKFWVRLWSSLLAFRNFLLRLAFYHNY